MVAVIVMVVAIGVNEQKLCRIAKEELEICAASGKARPFLYTYGKELVRNALGDIHPNESYNSLVRGGCTRNRRIGLPLLSARCSNKKRVGVGHRGSTSKWSSIRTAAKTLHKVAATYTGEAADIVLNDPDRWATPEPADAIDKKHVELSSSTYGQSLGED